MHRGGRRIYAGDVGPDGRLRLDGVLRLLQDVAGDDLEGGEGARSAWVVRRTLVEVRRPARLREHVELTTWCSGTGRRWAERRTSMVGERGARIESAALWVHVDPASGRPVPVAEDYLASLPGAARARQVSARLSHATVLPDDIVSLPWRQRHADLDVMGHVNNAIAGAVVEEAVASEVGVGARSASAFRVALEYRNPIDPGAALEVVVAGDGDGVRVWVVRAGTAVPGRDLPSTAVHVTAVLDVC